MSLQVKLIVTILFNMYAVSAALGGQKTWNGSQSNQWDVPQNWTPTGVPTITDTVAIPFASTAPKVSPNQAVCAALTVRTFGFLQLVDDGKTLTVAGDVQIQGLGMLVFTKDSRIRVRGNWINNGIFLTNDAISGGVEFNGTTQQTVSGKTVFFDLIVNNSAGVVLAGDQEIKGTLLLQNGLIRLGENNLTIRAAATVAGISAVRYIVTDGSGSLIRNNVGTTETSFPVGTSSSYNPVTLRTGSGRDTFSVHVQDEVWPAVPNSQSAVQKTWTVSESTPGGNGMLRLTLQWNGADQGSAFTPLDAGSWKYNGTAWVLDGAIVGSVTGADPYVATIDASALSGFVLANASSPLPIQLASFTGTVTSTSVLLNWMTMTETNNFGFEVQRSADNSVTYSTIPGSFIQGQGTTNTPHAYAYTDQPGSGHWYYRLKQIDLDGTTHYTDGILVDFLTDVDETIPRAFRLEQNYPNPFNPATEIGFSVAELGHTSLVVYNALGQEITTLYNGVAEPGRQYTVKFAADDLASGVYYYRLNNGSVAELKKMLLMK